MDNITGQSLIRIDSFKADDFAVLLGLKKSEPGDGNATDNEIERMTRLLMFYLPRIRLHSESQQDIVWSRFGALYLPALASRVLDPPPAITPDTTIREDYIVHNAYSEILVEIQHVPYFFKYLRSSKPLAADGKRLPGVLAKRLLDRASSWDQGMIHPPQGAPDDYYVCVATNACQMLCTLCTAFLKSKDQETVVPAETKRRLESWLRRWAQRYRGQPFGDICLRTGYLFSGQTALRHEYNSVRRVHKNWEVCGLPGCDVKENLKACGRCQTVRYCCSQHQTTHWKYTGDMPHKQLCHPTEY